MEERAMFTIPRTSDAAREARLRRSAKRLGYALKRSSWRRGSIDNLGGFQIIDPYRNWIVGGERFNLDLDGVEAWLAKRSA
jgi:hypothetical protein